MLLSCSPTAPYTKKDRYKRYNKVSFCDLITYSNKEVYIEGIFSGSDKDYMFLGSNREDCNTLPRLCLDFKNFNQLSKSIKDKYITVRNNPQTMYLTVKGVGKYISNAKCGHLSAHNHAFILKEVVSIELMKK